jgi:M6 family metalloprotease-like protein
MNHIKLLIAFLIVSTGITFGQTINKDNLSLSHPVKYGSNEPRKIKKFNNSSSDTIRIVAVMVQFQEDNDPRTTGNGKMDLSNKYFDPALNKDTVIDSPPYDSAYFADHLEFLKNYYYKSSKGKLIIDYKLYGELITLPNVMSHYSPQKNENFTKYGYLFNDTWARADSIMDLSGYDTSNTAFVIFHAGVGKDINLESIFGYDPYPYDIASIYMGYKNLQEIQINGYTTRSGFLIKNSMIIPSTELRELNLISGNYLLQLGINGILAANVGSFLGLPDLFNTVEGSTAIGRFGLMDGQSILSFNGIFPPEPSAWEKIYLGWVEPVVISNGDQYLNLKTSSKNTNADSTIIKVLINSKEYFLIENRNRSWDNSGQTVYTRNRAFRDSLKFTKDVPGFVNYDIYAVNGNVTDVKYFDWSLPGAISDTCNFSGGILIWHIDENIIDAKIGTNTINGDIKNRGVKLMEAKGSQDIGISYNTPFGEVVSDGYFVDFWYKGNHYVPSTIYKNEFTPSSFPNTLSNSGANNNIFITEFDSISSNMKIRIKIGSDVIRPISGFPKFIGKDNCCNYNQPIAFDLDGDGKDEFFVNNTYNVYGYKFDGTPISSNPNGILVYNYGLMPVTSSFSSKYNNNRKLVLVSNSNKLGLFNISNGLISDSTVETLPATGISTYPLVYDSSKVIFGFGNGWIYEKKLDNSTNYIDSSGRSSVSIFSKINNNQYAYRTANDKYIITGNLTGTNSTDSLELQYSNNKFYLNGRQIIINYNLNHVQNPILADVNKDGKQEIIFSSDEGIFAINSAGVLLENFPVKFNKKVSPGIAAGDINNDGIIDLVFMTTDGDLYAYGINGKLCSGYPIKTGSNTISTPALANLNDTLGIIVYGGDGYLYAYKTNSRYDESKILWKNFLKDKYLSNNNFKYLNSSVNFTEKLPADKVYNWPNPVYDSKTYIRYFINGNATTATIKIMDLSGELVTTLKGTALSNADNEVVWDVSTVQSGIYYGVIEVEIDGSKERKIIKIAVVK